MHGPGINGSPERTLSSITLLHHTNAGEAAHLNVSGHTGGYMLFVCDRPLAWILTVLVTLAVALIGVATLTTASHMQQLRVVDQDVLGRVQ
eukprot:SAG31_NODE_2778_length_5104_cov_2.424775_1_plen_91_part_00